VWISIQIGCTGVLAGFLDSARRQPRSRSTLTRRVSPHRPACGGSYELDLTDNGYRFPQTWRTNAGFDRAAVGPFTGTVDNL
jgi:hypothetical protein